MSNLLINTYRATHFFMVTLIVLFAIIACLYISKQANELGKVKLDKDGLRHDEALAIVPKNHYDRGVDSTKFAFVNHQSANEPRLFNELDYEGVDQNDLRSDEVLAIVTNEAYERDSGRTMILISSESYYKVDEPDIIIREDELLVIKSKDDYDKK